MALGPRLAARSGHSSSYRWLAASLGGLIQQLAVCYIGRGYWFYVTGVIPERKDPLAVDEKLLDRYGIGISKFARARRKQAGWANMQYIRRDRFFVLLATPGKHRFFEDEAGQIRDARRVPLKHEGYSIGYRGGHPHVRIEMKEYKALKAYFEQIAVRRSVLDLADEFGHLTYEPYAPVRRQLLVMLRAVNRARASAGLELVPQSCLRLKRRIFPAFASQDESSD